MELYQKCERCHTDMCINSGDDVWIGLSDGHTEGVWRWPNGKVASWGNWEPGHPSGGDSKNCAFKKSGNEGYWVSEDCSATKYFICQDETGTQMV